MKHLAAYLLLRLGGNDSPSASDIKDVLGSVGIDADDERLSKLLNELHGKDIDELIRVGSSKLAVTSVGDTGVVVGEQVEKGATQEEPHGGEVEGEDGDDHDDDFLGFSLFE